MTLTHRIHEQTRSAIPIFEMPDASSSVGASLLAIAVHQQHSGPLFIVTPRD
jgi:hypothetical protein